MAEEAAEPLLGDLHLNLHGDAADGNNRKEEEKLLALASRTDWMPSWYWEETPLYSGYPNSEPA